MSRKGPKEQPVPDVPEDDLEEDQYLEEDEFDDEDIPEPSVFSRRRVIIGLLALGGALSALGVYKCTDFPPSFSKEEVEKAKVKKNEYMGRETELMKKYGGETYKMSRLPGMAEKHFKARGNVYINIPEKANKKRVLVFLHGNGDQTFRENTMPNVIECIKKLNIPLIAPQDGWANAHPEKILPGNWEDLNDPQFLYTLIRFMEGRTGTSASQIWIGSFSGGNIGVTKLLRALEKGKDSVSKDLYDRIERIAFFDSAMGEERDHVATWMDENSDARVFSCFNENAGGIKGRWHNGNKAYKSGNNLLRQALEKKHISSSRFQIDQIPKKKSVGHGVAPGKCEEYFSKE